MNALRLSISGFLFRILQTPIYRSHQRMQSLCQNHSKPKSLSIRAKGKRMTYQERMMYSQRATHGQNSKPHLCVATLPRSKLISKRRIRSGFTWARAPPRQGRNSQRIFRNRDIIREVTSLTQYPSQSPLFPDNPMQLPTHQQSLRML